MVQVAPVEGEQGSTCGAGNGEGNPGPALLVLEHSENKTVAKHGMKKQRISPIFATISTILLTR